MGRALIGKGHYFAMTREWRSVYIVFISTNYTTVENHMGCFNYAMLFWEAVDYYQQLTIR